MDGALNGESRQDIDVLRRPKAFPEDENKIAFEGV